MDETTDSQRHIAGIAIVFEGGLVLVALGIGWLVQRWPLPGVSLDAWGWADQGVAVAWGAVAALPMIVGLLLADRFPLGPLRGLQTAIEELVLPWLRGWTFWEITLISMAAGVGEEMLFRGLLQAWLTDILPGPWGIVIALAVASVLFGVCHWITTSYAVVAALMGLYLGGLLLLTDNLLTPIATHAVYDFAALIYLTRTPRNRD